MENVALLIDGGHLRSVAMNANIIYDVDFIEDFSDECYDSADENMRRILYYDCPQYRGRQRLPVSGNVKVFESSDDWLVELASRELFAVRRGTLAFRGWVPRNIPIAGDQLTDEHFKPNFEQKGVDMRIGLDIAMIAAERRIDRIILVTADSDLIPAMKHARKANLQVVGVQLPHPPANELRPLFKAHTDYVRLVQWPASARQAPPPEA